MKELRRKDRAITEEEAVVLLNKAEYGVLSTVTENGKPYPLLLNSFKHCYLNLAGQFFSDPTVVPVEFNFHKKMVKAIKDKNEKSAAGIMEHMLAHGAEHLQWS